MAFHRKLIVAMAALMVSALAGGICDDENGKLQQAIAALRCGIVVATPSLTTTRPPPTTTMTATAIPGACVVPTGLAMGVKMSAGCQNQFPVSVCMLSCMDGYKGDSVALTCYDADAGYVGMQPNCVINAAVPSIHFKRDHLQLCYNLLTGVRHCPSWNRDWENYEEWLNDTLATEDRPLLL